MLNDFMIRIDLSQAVFTTKYVLEGQSSMVHVSHDKNCDWQFFGKEQNITEENARVISLGEILKINPSVKQILRIRRNRKLCKK